jgi:8-oxo-dGTP pyrophosphatase MutT (NUDIX family)
LPGGRREDGEPLQETALREAHEEVGIDPRAVSLLGSLASLYILPSDFEVFPFVGWHEGMPAFVPQLSEVAEIIEVPLAHILDERLRQEEVWERKGVSMIVPYFQIGEHKVWGATAMMLSEFAERLREQSDGNLTALPED